MGFFRTLKRYIAPRNNQLKQIVMYIMAFVLFVIVYEEIFNESDPAKQNLNSDLNAADGLYNRERFGNHPKNIQIAENGDKNFGFKENFQKIISFLKRTPNNLKRILYILFESI
jgi:hypothetical protein